MACILNNKCAKNLSKRTVLLQLIIKNVVTCFFSEHSVDHFGDKDDQGNVNASKVKMLKWELTLRASLCKTTSVFFSTQTNIVQLKL